MDFQKEGKMCVTCGYNREYERSMAFAEITSLQESIQTMGFNYNQLNMAMVQVKNKNIILKNEIKMLKLNQKNPNVQGGRKKKENQSVV